MIVAIVFCGGGVANAQGLPSYMAPIGGTKPLRRQKTSRPKTCWRSNTGMFELYGDAAKIFQKNFLSNHPVILGLFSGAGGRLISIVPECPRWTAPQVPVVYQPDEICRSQHDGAGRGGRRPI